MNSSRQAKVAFAALPWQTAAPGARFKSVVRQGKTLRLVEFSREFVEPDWCRKGHRGCVLAGTLEIQFTDRTERFVAGDAIFIEAGEAEKHRAHVSGEPALLLLAEEEEAK